MSGRELPPAPILFPGDQSLAGPAPTRPSITFVDGPLDGQRRESDDQPASLPARGGRYVRSVRCADDGDLRYVFQPAGR